MGLGAVAYLEMEAMQQNKAAYNSLQCFTACLPQIAFIGVSYYNYQMDVQRENKTSASARKSSHKNVFFLCKSCKGGARSISPPRFQYNTRVVHRATTVRTQV